MRGKDRVDATMDVGFEGGDRRESVSVWIPFETFIAEVREYFDAGMVTIDGTDLAIWNSLVGCGSVGNLMDNDEILGFCEDLYKGTRYEDEDYSDWLSDIEWESKED